MIRTEQVEGGFILVYVNSDSPGDSAHVGSFEYGGDGDLRFHANEEGIGLSAQEMRDIAAVLDAMNEEWHARAMRAASGQQELRYADEAGLPEG